MVFGKRSYPFEVLYANYAELVKVLLGKKPSNLKTAFVTHAQISTDHGPAFIVNPAYVTRANKRFEFA